MTHERWGLDAIPEGKIIDSEGKNAVLDIN